MMRSVSEVRRFLRIMLSLLRRLIRFFNALEIRKERSPGDESFRSL